MRSSSQCPSRDRSAEHVRTRRLCQPHDKPRVPHPEVSQKSRFRPSCPCDVFEVKSFLPLNAFGILCHVPVAHGEVQGLPIMRPIETDLGDGEDGSVYRRAGAAPWETLVFLLRAGRNLYYTVFTVSMRKIPTQPN